MARAASPVRVRPRPWVPVASAAALLASLSLQAVLPALHSAAGVVNLPLIVLVRLATRSQPVLWVTLAATATGLAQDGLTHQPAGILGLAYTILGYVLAVWSRHLQIMLVPVQCLFVAAAYLLHEVLVLGTRRFLLGQAQEPEPALWLALAVVHAGLAMVVNPLLDRLPEQP